jgi:ATP-dependent exoDNAse (exonuclease V) beta subunit
MILADLEPRMRCLTDFETILSVEAAAGTGKTSLLAGRVVMLLASGCPPHEIAAITYTELAAGELARRIQHTIEMLLAGGMPPELEPCFPAGLDARSKENLQIASTELDGLTVATIHGFCKIIISDHAIAAGMDPGMTVADEGVAGNLMDDAFAAWLRSVLDDTAAENEPIVEMCRRDPRGTVSTLRNIILLRLEHRTAQAVTPNREVRPDIVLCEAINAFTRWVASNPEDVWTGRLAEQCSALRAHYVDSFADDQEFSRLWNLSEPPRLDCMLKNAARFAEYKREPAWRQALGDKAGALKAAQAKALLGAVDTALASLLGEVGTRLVHAVSARLDGVFERYESAKTRAAVLDFQDLLVHAHRLVTRHDEVRTAVAGRFQRILVDEFQDTDPIQCEILFAIAAADGAASGLGAPLRSGSLFLVGDPKQAIYRFRGADIATYTRAREAVIALTNGASVDIVSNFRSTPSIVNFVNDKFQSVFLAPYQPNYVPLAATVQGKPDETCVFQLALDGGAERAGANAVRDLEALRIAKLCKELVGRFTIRTPGGGERPATPGDIALLAPGHTELWRYERALEAEDLQVASQASKALARRQETQDVLALMRTISNGSDRLAFGALMRGPLVGLTDGELLDITAALNNGGTGPWRYFDVRTDAALVAEPYARSTLETLQSLRLRRHSLTPAMLLSEAIEALSMRLVLASRYTSKNAQALANIDALVERARRFSISGIDRFIDDLQERWERLEQMVEGRIDSSEEAVHLVSMHSCKGLEWPIVIPINSVTTFRKADAFVHRRSDDTLHWVLAGARPPHLEDAMREEQQAAARERERLMYVACTRARDLLVMPNPPTRDSSTWTGVVELGINSLPLLKTPIAVIETPPVLESPPNAQTSAVFLAEAARVADSAEHIVWRQPSAHDPSRFTLEPAPSSDIDDVVTVEIPVGVGLDRGSVLHKLVEEVLTGELALDESTLKERSVQLIEQIRAATGRSDGVPPLPEQLARTMVETFSIPEVAALRPYLVPEVTVWGSAEDALISGRADCLVVREEQVLGVVDWKSDVSPTDEVVQSYIDQVQQYMRVAGTSVGMLCFMTHGKVVWIGNRQVLYESLGIADVFA